MSRIRARGPMNVWPKARTHACVCLPLAAGEMGREGAIPRRRQLDSRSRGPALPAGQSAAKPRVVETSCRVSPSPFGLRSLLSNPLSQAFKSRPLERASDWLAPTIFDFSRRPTTTGPGTKKRRSQPTPNPPTSPPSATQLQQQAHVQIRFSSLAAAAQHRSFHLFFWP